MGSTAYEGLLEDVLTTGTHKDDRTGTGTTSVFARQIRFDLSEGFPLITSKAVKFKSVAYELLWFLRGDTNIQWLQENGVTIWNEWADDEGNLGRVYGAQWRAWLGASGEPIDQIANVIESIKTNPNSRRHIVTAWNPAEIEGVGLPPCHVMFQFDVRDGKLSCALTQRSADMFLGVPFNIASYALLTHMVAQQCDLEVGELIWTGNDVHIYDNHLDQVREQLSREYRPLPELFFARKPEDIFSYEFEDFQIEGYDPHPFIKGAVAV